MRIIITVEDSPPPPAGEPEQSAMNLQADNAGVALNVAAAADQTPSGLADQALTEGAISAGPPADPPTSAEPIFLPGSVEATEPTPDPSDGSADLSAGPAPAIA